MFNRNLKKRVRNLEENVWFLSNPFPLKIGDIATLCVPATGYKVTGTIVKIERARSTDLFEIIPWYYWTVTVYDSENKQSSTLKNPEIV